MDRLLELLVDNDSVVGRLVTTTAVVVLAMVLATAAGRLAPRHSTDPYARYYARKAARYAVATVALIALAAVWRPFAGNLGVVLGLVTAGLAFAMQEVISALAGGFNILSGRIFRVGDRIQMGGVRGDVIDITPLRTKIMEMGSATDEDSWVRGRQYTGRIVTVSNKATFTEPVYNYSAAFDFLWEELSIPVAHTQDWQGAERILLEEARRVSASEGAEQAMAEMTRRYPVPRTEVEPRVFVQASDNYMKLSARFVVPMRSARSTKDMMTRRVVERMATAGIQVASATMDVTLREESRGDGSGGGR